MNLSRTYIFKSNVCLKFEMEQLISMYVELLYVHSWCNKRNSSHMVNSNFAELSNIHYQYCKSQMFIPVKYTRSIHKMSVMNEWCYKPQI